MHVTLIFFASVREAIGMEKKSHTTTCTNIADLRKELAQAGGVWSIITNAQTLVAVNQELCDGQQPIHENDEVAFFPFMTGG